MFGRESVLSEDTSLCFEQWVIPVVYDETVRPGWIAALRMDDIGDAEVLSCRVANLLKTFRIHAGDAS